VQLVPFLGRRGHLLCAVWRRRRYRPSEAL
jgi:hypothetical protein